MSSILQFGYVPGDSIIHRLDAKTKIVILLLTIIFTYLFKDVYILGAYLLAFLIIIRVGRIHKHVYKIIAIASVPFFVFSIIAIGFTTGFVPNKTPLLSFSFLGHIIVLYLEGVLFVTIFALRVSVAIAATLLCILTISPTDMTATLMSLPIPYKFTYVFIAALQLIPILVREVDMVHQAQVSRGLDIKVSLVNRMKSIFFLIVPLTLDSIYQAQMRAVALEIRGFSVPVKKTIVQEPKLKIQDYAVFAVLISLTALFIYLIFTKGRTPFMV